MRKNSLWQICATIVLAFIIISWTSDKFGGPKSKTSSDSLANTSTKMFSSYVADIFTTARLNEAGLDEAVFEKAVTGYFNLKMANKLSANSSVITVVDFNKSSKSKRMWIVDLSKKVLLLNTWVAHGNGSGEDVPCRFSNQKDSFESSLGFYVTNNVYNGKHGVSLRLDGMDEGFNDQANNRDIVVHAAPYVSQGSINALGRLGRSQGCPAVSPSVVNQVINTIKGKTVLFINANDSSYNSKYLNQDLAANFSFGNPVNATALNASL
ncbi:murein L,D-transpeptidase catalytic domain family protein [Mucilaginibacter sp. HMF5004]|uniref:murein L,D-transpeptidase catalytic domain family protein n=1 Tax=Mucilaginibacter rivuli TaxID=2857527 RepID=UPI001C5DF08B|nr:murein L,D-transpeptidase catalytic domain family protein [Mucilaginibacter rivuli]MBW4891496.1 murein L,D-transpeptidase catalytic domain family protein [Mucilaginibacter rivuli]